MSPDDPSPEETDDPPPSKTQAKPSEPSLTPRAAAGKAERAERVAAEMRKNLMKRKQQQRAKQSDS